MTTLCPTGKDGDGNCLWSIFPLSTSGTGIMFVCPTSNTFNRFCVFCCILPGDLHALLDSCCDTGFGIFNDNMVRHSKSVKISTSALFAPKNSTKKRVNPSAIKFATKHRKQLIVLIVKLSTAVLIAQKLAKLC